MRCACGTSPAAAAISGSCPAAGPHLHRQPAQLAQQAMQLQQLCLGQTPQRVHCPAIQARVALAARHRRLLEDTLQAQPPTIRRVEDDLALSPLVHGADTNAHVWQSESTLASCMRHDAWHAGWPGPPGEVASSCGSSKLQQVWGHCMVLLVALGHPAPASGGPVHAGPLLGTSLASFHSASCGDLAGRRLGCVTAPMAQNSHSKAQALHATKVAQLLPRLHLVPSDIAQQQAGADGPKS